MVDIPSGSSGTRRAHGPSPKTDTYGWYRTPAHSQPPPPIPPKVSGSNRSSDSSIAGVQKPYAQKVRGSDGPEGNEFMAELEGDMVGLGLPNVNTGKKKGKRSPDAEAIAQAIVSQSRAPPRKRKIRVLSLDGGGIRGYSTLVILSDIMHRIHVLINKNVPVAPHQLPRPCDFFDIIGGNGTGGLIALMLGRMRMDVETCKDYYEDLTRYVFYTDKTILGLPYGKTLFKASRLEEAIKVCVRECTRFDHLPLVHYLPLNRRDSMKESSPLPQIQPASTIRCYGNRKGSWPKERKGPNPTNSHGYGTTATFSSFSSNNTVSGNRLSRSSNEFSSFATARGNRIDNTLGNSETPLYDHRIGACRTFVTTSYISSVRGSPPVILRSYQTARDPGTVSTKATIWQAGRATCAYRSAFKPITIANVQFLDEGYGKYNPAFSVLDEALAKETWHDIEDEVVDDQGPEIGVFVSIGTGKRLGSQHDDGMKHGGLRKDKPLWWESMGMLEQYAEAKKRLLEKLEDCETVHQTMRGEMVRRGVDPSCYYRFNVEVGVGEFGMNEWNRLAEVSTGTRRYMDRPEVNTSVGTCAEKLVNIWHENEMREKWKFEGPPPIDELTPQLDSVPVNDSVDEEVQKKKERDRRRAAKKTSAKGGAKHESPPLSPSSMAELEADIDQAASEWSSPQHTGSHSGSDGEYYPSAQSNRHQIPMPQQAYRPPPLQQQRPGLEYYSPPPQRPQQGYNPPQHVSQWVQQLSGQLPQYQHPIPFPSAADFLPPKIVTSPPPAGDEASNLPEDYFNGGPNPEIRVISPTTVAGDETPPGTPRPLRKTRSIEGDRQARKEKREKKLRKEREEREARERRAQGQGNGHEPDMI
ncbi:acyl transferase/acyl hydrolase/lysophospholipase [Tirmania nivea]|nr:acyl transferase/acyl hydrolase/lysophospholipase [Tirmania nivea]